MDNTSNSKDCALNGSMDDISSMTIRGVQHDRIHGHFKNYDQVITALTQYHNEGKHGFLFAEIAESSTEFFFTLDLEKHIGAYCTIARESEKRAKGYAKPLKFYVSTYKKRIGFLSPEQVAEYLRSLPPEPRPAHLI